MKITICDICKRIPNKNTELGHLYRITLQKGNSWSEFFDEDKVKYVCSECINKIFNQND